MPLAGGWSHGRCYASLSSLCRSWVLIASIVVIVIGVHGIVDLAADLCIHVLVRRRLVP